MSFTRHRLASDSTLLTCCRAAERWSQSDVNVDSDANSCPQAAPSRPRPSSRTSATSKRPAQRVRKLFSLTRSRIHATGQCCRCPVSSMANGWSAQRPCCSPGHQRAGRGEPCRLQEQAGRQCLFHLSSLFTTLPASMPPHHVILTLYWRAKIEFILDYLGPAVPAPRRRGRLSAQGVRREEGPAGPAGGATAPAFLIKIRKALAFYICLSYLCRYTASHASCEYV